MSKLAETIAEQLGIDRQQAAGAPELIRKQAFFQRLAEHGITPKSDQEAIRLLQASDVLEAKTASFEQALNPVTRATDMLLGKQAQAPGRAAPSIDQERQGAVGSYLQACLQDPVTYAALLTQVV